MQHEVSSRRRVAWLSGRPAKYAVAAIGVAFFLLIGGLEYGHVINQPQVDLAFSGALTGRMTHLQDWQGHPTECSTARVQGSTEWTGQFVGILNGHHMEIDIALYPFRGAGGYTNAGVPDAHALATVPFPQAFGPLPIHILLSSMPTGAPDVRQWGTEPNPAHRPKTMDELSKLAGLGKASVSLNPDQKSGRVDAVLMNATALGATPTHLSGTFRCVVLGKGTDLP